jgi:hypothetical protein
MGHGPQCRAFLARRRGDNRREQRGIVIEPRRWAKNALHYALQRVMDAKS